MFPKWLRMVGFVLHLLMGGLFIFAGVMKVNPNPPPEMKQQMEKMLGDKVQLIGAGEIVTGLLLIVPVTSSLGVHMSSGLWGGIICFKMFHNEEFLSPSVMLVVLWIAAFLRDPRALWSFRPAGLPPEALATPNPSP